MSWSNTGTITPLKPIFECVLEDNEACLLEGVYKQLYPTHILGHMPRFFRKFGRVTIPGDLVGSDMPGTNSNSSSVVMAFWPERGSNLSSTDYSKKSVGVMQYFLQHTITYNHTTNSDIKKADHLFALVCWKELHCCHDYYGVSATLCNDIFQPLDLCSFLPIQCILCHCAHAVMPVTISNITETLFFACPVPFKYSM